MSGKGYDEFAWIAQWVERGQRLAQELEGWLDPEEEGRWGAVARAVVDGQLLVTPELVEQVRRWRQAQQSGQEQAGEREARARRKLDQVVEVAQVAVDVEVVEVEASPLEACAVEEVEEAEVTPQSTFRAEGEATAEAALDQLLSRFGAPQDEPEPDPIPEPEMEEEDEEADPFLAIFAKARAKKQTSAPTSVEASTQHSPTLTPTAQAVLEQLREQTREGAPVRSRELATHCGLKRAAVEAALEELEGEVLAQRRGTGWVTVGAPTETVRVREAGELIAVLEVQRQADGGASYLNPATGQVWGSLEAARRDLLAREVG